jgi:hypothetical protein
MRCPFRRGRLLTLIRNFFDGLVVVSSPELTVAASLVRCAVGREQGRPVQGLPPIHSARGPVSDLWGAELRHGSVLPELRLTFGSGRCS